MSFSKNPFSEDGKDDKIAVVCFCGKRYKVNKNYAGASAKCSACCGLAL